MSIYFHGVFRGKLLLGHKPRGWGLEWCSQKFCTSSKIGKQNMLSMPHMCPKVLQMLKNCNYKFISHHLLRNKLNALET